MLLGGPRSVGPGTPSAGKRFQRPAPLNFAVRLQRDGRLPNPHWTLAGSLRDKEHAGIAHQKRDTSLLV
jgi:hypothetical protein